MERKENNAQHFLELIKKSRTGKFKIYIGMSAGVGKTYRMLQEARSLLRNGIDIKIGYIETHNRKETQELTEGLPIIPRRQLFYKGKQLDELDVPAVINLRPEVVIIDELAHSNIEGSKNEKRWQDVLQILESGINVISAVNIQHIESLNESIKQITGITVNETIPDKVLQLADEVVNIDLTAEELINRLKEGKIYTTDKIQLALSNFFRPEHILQLRELALKAVASQVQRKVITEISRNGGTTFRHEKFLACISSNERAAKVIIKKTARLAGYYNSSWSLLYVQTPGESDYKIPLDKQRHLINHFKMATELGAEIIRTEHKDIAGTITTTALEKGITTICIGRPYFNLIRSVLNITLFDRLLIKLTGTDIDIVILS